MIRRLLRIPSRLKSELWLRLGIPLPIRSLDRKVLETQILPTIAAQYPRVLFVGCESYTAHYSRMFRRNDFHTIDFDPKKKRYGGRQHIVGSALDLPKYYEPASFDAVIFNGILGYGVDVLEPAETCIAACRAVLKPGGLLVVGWNDLPHIRPLFVQNKELRRDLLPEAFAPLRVTQTEPLEGGRHTYSFFKKVGLGVKVASSS